MIAFPGSSNENNVDDLSLDPLDNIGVHEEQSNLRACRRKSMLKKMKRMRQMYLKMLYRMLSRMFKTTISMPASVTSCI